MLSRRVIPVLSVVIVTALIVAGFVIVRRFDATPNKQPEIRVAALPVIESTSWHETHATVEIHAQPHGGPRDTAIISEAFAELPGAAPNGMTLHLLVTVPDWAVFDDSGKPNEGSDGVVLSVVNPDMGIGLELTRLVLNPAQLAADRKWHSVEVHVPPCTRRIAIQALAGTSPTSNNWFDRLWVSASEPLVFHRASPLRPSPDSGAAACEDSTVTRACGDGGSRECSQEEGGKSTRLPSGALHTGPR